MEQGFPYFNANANAVLQFLQRQLELKPSARYGTFNSHRSALSLLLGTDVVDNSMVRRFLNGVFRLRPSQRRYSSTWDPKIVLDYMDNLEPNEDLSIQLLTQKLATLLMLITAHRLKTLACIRVVCIVVSPEKIQIFITDHQKTTSVRSIQPCLQIRVASTLLEYINRTVTIRNTSQDYLFISTRKPYCTASSQAISKWVKRMLDHAKIDTQIFTGYSAKHAGTSAAFKAGVSLSNIRQTAGWSEKSTVFHQFYNRPTATSVAFANAVLSL